MPLAKYNDGRLKVLKFEDLEHDHTLHEICKWLGVSYHLCLRESTWGGMRWWGDRVSKKAVPENERGFSKTISSDNWEKKLNIIDRTILNYLLFDQLEWYGYSCYRQKGPLIAMFIALAILLPTGYERRYLAPKYLLRLIKEKDPLMIVRSFYHPLRRMLQFYMWFYRRNFGTYFAVDYISSVRNKDV